MADRFIVRRMGALGDVILTTPIIRRLRREYPDALIHIITAYPEVFRDSPYFNGPFKAIDYTVPPIEIDLDLSYEKQPHTHIVQAYMQEAFGDFGDPKDLQQELHYGFSFPGHAEYNRTKYVAIHAAVAGWKNRTLPRHLWHNVVAGVRRMGFKPVMVGAERDRLPGTLAFTGLLDKPLLQQTAVIADCAAFIGSDSSLLHAAGATATPIVGVFTCARPETRLPFRHGVLGWRCVAVMPDIECIGCLARRGPPVTSERCERGDNICVTSVTAEAILAALQKIIQPEGVDDVL